MRLPLVANAKTVVSGAAEAGGEAAEETSLNFYLILIACLGDKEKGSMTVLPLSTRQALQWQGLPRSYNSLAGYRYQTFLYLSPTKEGVSLCSSPLPFS